ncbi:MAG: hypothetical protein ACAI34_16215 [Verrucomicrobium sp.]
METDAGLLPEAAKNVLNLIDRADSNSSRETLQKLLDQVLAKHVQEMDRILAIQKWADVGQDADDFAYGAAALLETSSARYQEKGARVVRHVFKLLLQSPEERAFTGPRVREQPSSAFLIRLGASPALMATVLDIADEYKLTRDAGWAIDYANQMSSLVMTESIPQMLPAFTQSLLVAEADGFRDLCLPGTSSESLLGEVVFPLVYAPYRNDLRQQVLKALATRQPRTFGLELTEVMLVRDNQELIKGFLKRRQTDLRKLRPEAASTLLSLFNISFYAIGSPAPLPSDLESLLKPLLESEKIYLESEWLAWQSCQTLQDSGLSGEAAVAHALRLIGRLVVRSPADVPRFFDHTVALLRLNHQDGAREQLGAFLREAATIPELVATALRHARKEGVSQAQDWLQGTFSRAWLPGNHVEQPQRLMMILEAAGLLGDVRSFANQWSPGDNHVKGFVPRIKLTLEARRNAYEAFVPVLRHHQPRTFGSEMLLALITSENDSTIARVVANREKDITDLPADLQAEMIAFLCEWVWDLDYLGRVAPSLQPVLQPHQERRRSAAEEELTLILRANRLEDIRKEAARELNALIKGKGDRASLSFEKIVANLSLMMQISPDRALEGFSKMEELIRQTDEKRGWPVSWPFSQTGLGGWYLLCASHPSLLEPVRLALTRANVNLDSAWVQKSEERMMPVSVFSDAGNVLALLECRQYLGKDVRFGKERTFTSRPVLELVAQRFVGMTSSNRQELAGLLRNRPVKTAGAEFMRAFLAHSRNEAEMHLDENAAVLRALEPEDKVAALKALRVAVPEIAASPVGAGPDAGALQNLLQQEQADESRLIAALQMSETPLPISPARGWVRVISDELTRLMSKGKEDLAARLFDLAMARLNEPSAAGRKSPVFTGPMIARRLPLEPFLEGSGSFELLGLTLQRMQADRTGLMVPLPEAGRVSETSLFEQVWREKGGLVNPGAAMGEMLTELELYRRGAPAACLAVPFYHFIKQVPKPLRMEILAWADTQREQAQVKPLIREMEFAARRANLLSDSEVDLGEDPALWEHFQQVVTDGTINPFVRLQVGSSLCREHGARVPAAVVVPVVQLALGSWKERSVVPVIDAPVILGCFARLPVTPGWRAVAEPLAAEWERRMVEARQDGASQVYMEVFQALVITLCQLQDESRLDLFFEANRHPAENWPAVLAGYGMKRRAAEVMRRDWKQVAAALSRPTGRFVLNVPPPPGPVVSDFISEFRAEEGDLALLAECCWMLAAKPVGAAASSGQAKVWSARMDEFVSRVVKSPLVHRERRMHLHTLLVRAHPASLSPLAALIKADAAALTVEQLGAFASPATPSATLSLEVSATWAASLVEKGDLSVLQNDLTRVVAAMRMTDRHNDNARAVGRAFYLRRLLECLQPWFSGWPRQRQEALLNAMLQASPLEDYIRVPAQGDELVVKQALRMLAQAFELQMENTSPTDNGVRSLPVEHDEKIRTLLHGLSASGERQLPEPVRRNLLRELLKLPSVQRGLADRSLTVPALIKQSPVLSSAELVQDAPALIETSSLGGLAAKDLALLAVELNNLQSGTDCLDVAIRQSTPSDSSALSSSRDRLLLLKAAFLIRQKKVSDARRTLDQVLPASSTKEKESLLKLINTAN